MLNGHGDDAYLYDGKIVSNFSSNVYNGLDLSGLHRHLCEKVLLIHSYPEPDGCSFVKLLADHHSMQTENICLTNGATEGIYLIAQAFRNKKAAILIPAFSEYEDACLANDMPIQFASELSDIGNDTELIWLCNPNNPTGNVIPKEVLVSFVEDHKRSVIVIDQSYSFFTSEEISDTTDLVKYENVILLHSLTKKYAIPGLRLGYIAAHEDLIKRIRKFTMPWSVNQLSIEAGKYLMENDISRQLDMDAYLSESKRLQHELAKTNDVTVYPSDTHFFLCELHSRKASDLKEFLVSEYGILIRDASNFRGLDKGYFRIATQSSAENDCLIDALKGWMLCSSI